jgi:hypothetical protein
MNCIAYTVSCNFATHAICLLAFMTYKYSELQVSFVIQKLSCKASCKTQIFFIVNGFDQMHFIFFNHGLRL